MRAKTLTAILVALLLTRLLPIWQPLSAAYADSTHHVVGGGNSVVSFNMNLASTTAGNIVVVCAVSNRGGGPQPTLTVTDGGNTWTQAGLKYTDPQAAAISYSILATGGTRTINVSANGVNSYNMFGAAREFSGNAASSPASGSATGGSGTSVTMDTSAMTPADNDVLVTACGGPVSSGTITENVSPGDSGFTLSDEDESATNTPGSFVYKILSGAPGTPRAAWTVPSSAWAAEIAAFKPAAGGTITPHLRLLLGVGQ